MIAEAVDTLITLGWALAGWLIFFAAVASVLTLAAIATGAWAVRGAWRLLYARLRPETPPQAHGEGQDAHRPSEGPSRPAPSWATDKPHDYREAA